MFALIFKFKALEHKIKQINFNATVEQRIIQWQCKKTPFVELVHCKNVRLTFYTVRIYSNLFYCLSMLGCGTVCRHIYYRRHTCKIRASFLSCASFECSVVVHIHSKTAWIWIQCNVAPHRILYIPVFERNWSVILIMFSTKFYVEWSGWKVHLSMHERTIHQFLPARKLQGTEDRNFAFSVISMVFSSSPNLAVCPVDM